LYVDATLLQPAGDGSGNPWFLTGGDITPRLVRKTVDTMLAGIVFRS
jgi:hypothetical protein